jgi:hypothetical protein
MNKLKMLVLTGLAAATVGTGTLVAAPSASAQPNDGACEGIRAKAIAHLREAEEWGSIGANAAAHRHILLWQAYWDSYKICVGWPGVR